MKVINYENLRSYCYSNDKLIEGEIKGIALEFYGLGSQAMHGEDPMQGYLYARSGVLLIYPYSNPWGWMNSEEVALTDEILDVIFEKYNLPSNLPIISCGGSMGGLCALTYCAYAKRAVKACVANCPVCDFPFHYTEREDLPRTIYSALHHEGLELDEALRSRSPLHLTLDNKMPKINYYIFHCDTDHAVNIAAHSDKLVKAMNENGYSVKYEIVHNRSHCNLPLDAKEKYEQCVINEILN